MLNVKYPPASEERLKPKVGDVVTVTLEKNTARMRYYTGIVTNVRSVGDMSIVILDRSLQAEAWDLYTHHVVAGSYDLVIYPNATLVLEGLKS